MRDELDLITFDSGPGDVVLNHLLTVHGAPGNYTDRRRRALGGRWAGDGTVYAKREGRFNIALPWDPGLRDGDPFPPDNDLFPPGLAAAHPGPGNQGGRVRAVERRRM